MTRSKFLPGSSLALLLALIFGSANAQDATFDVETDNPAVAAELADKEEAMEDFFEEQDEADISLNDYEPTPDLNAREESALLERANQEATEFNDIDDDDLAELGREDTVRLEKPGQVEKDFPLTCPLGTEAVADGTCLAGPDWRWED